MLQSKGAVKYNALYSNFRKIIHHHPVCFMEYSFVMSLNNKPCNCISSFFIKIIYCYWLHTDAVIKMLYTTICSDKFQMSRMFTKYIFGIKNLLWLISHAWLSDKQKSSKVYAVYNFSGIFFSFYLLLNWLFLGYLRSDRHQI